MNIINSLTEKYDSVLLHLVKLCGVDIWKVKIYIFTISAREYLSKKKKKEHFEQ